jgi:8-oxo-dGTP diphosphatase
VLIGVDLEMKPPQQKNISSRPRILVITRAIIIQGKKFLLVKRAAHETYQPGIWEFPGGKLDDGQDISTALEREVLEETDLAITPIDKLAFFRSGIVTNNEKYNGITFIEIFGLAKALGGKAKLSEEHSDFRWISLSDIDEFEVNPNTKEALVALEDKLH